MTLPEPVEGELVPIRGESGELDTHKPSLRDMLREAWLTSRRTRNTRASYRSDINDYFDFCDRIGRDPLNTFRLTVDQYRNWLSEPDASRDHPEPYLLSTVARKLAAVSSFYRYCLSETTAVVSNNPVANVKRPSVANESTTRGLTLEEIDSLIDVATQEGGIYGAIIRLMIDTGVRVSEACNLTTADVEYEDGGMVISVTRKGGKRQRLPVPDDVRDAINAQRGTRRGPLFVGARNAKLARNVVARHLSDMATKAGIEGKVHPHMLRHAAATQLLNDNVPLREVQDMLGHSDPNTTYRYDRARRRIADSPVHRLAALRRSRKEGHANP